MKILSLNIQWIYYLSIRAVQYIDKMSDKTISEQLNKLFNKLSHYNLPVRGARNYLKVGRQSSVSYSYIDCYQVKGDIEHLLITIVQNLDGTCKVYKNALNFQYTSRVNTNGIDAIRINFVPNQNREQISIVSICYSYKNRKEIIKYAILGFDFATITGGEGLTLEQLSVNKKILQVRWHPTEQDLIVTLTEDSFEVIRYTQEIERVQSIRQRDIENKDRTIKLKQIEKSLKIIDFAFWHSQRQSNTDTLVATAQDGTLLLFLFTVFKDQDQEQSYGYQMVVGQILKRPSQITVKSIQVYSPTQRALLVFKKSISDSKNGQSSLIYISTIVKQNDTYIEQPLSCVQTDPEDGDLQIPYNKLYEGHFYFWYNNKLMRINLEPYLNYLNLFFKNPAKSRAAPTKLKTDIVVEVKENQMKFVAVDNSAIRVLRKAQTTQKYLFSTLAIETSDLLAEQHDTVQKLKTIFADLQSTMTQILGSKNQSLVSNLSQTLKSTLTYIKQNSDQKEIEGASQTFEAYNSEVQQKLVSEQKELNELFRQVDRLSHEFSSNKTKWRQLEQLLSRIENNSQVINDLERQQRTQSYEARTVDFIDKNCQTLKSRSLDINPDLRQQYLQSFTQQQNALWLISQALEQNEIMLQSFGSTSNSNSRSFKFQ